MPITAPDQSMYGGQQSLLPGQGALSLPFNYAAQAANRYGQRQMQDDLRRTQEMQQQLAQQELQQDALSSILGDISSMGDYMAHPTQRWDAVARELSGMDFTSLPQELQNVMDEGRALEPMIDNVGTSAGALRDLESAGLVSGALSSGDLARGQFGVQPGMTAADSANMQARMMSAQQDAIPDRPGLQAHLTSQGALAGFRITGDPSQLIMYENEINQAINQLFQPGSNVGQGLEQLREQQGQIPESLPDPATPPGPAQIGQQTTHMQQQRRDLPDFIESFRNRLAQEEDTYVLGDQPMVSVEPLRHRSDNQTVYRVTRELEDGTVERFLLDQYGNDIEG